MAKVQNTAVTFQENQFISISSSRTAVVVYFSAADIAFSYNQIVEWILPEIMSEKSYKSGSLMVAVVLNSAFIILLIIFAAHQQIQIANLKQIVKENIQGNADKRESCPSTTNPAQVKSEDEFPTLEVIQVSF